jgi:hypothetical protein
MGLEEAVVALVVLGGFLTLGVWELVWGVPQCVRGPAVRPGHAGAFPGFFSEGWRKRAGFATLL